MATKWTMHKRCPYMHELKLGRYTLSFYEPHSSWVLQENFGASMCVAYGLCASKEEAIKKCKAAIRSRKNSAIKFHDEIFAAFKNT